MHLRAADEVGAKEHALSKVPKRAPRVLGLAQDPGTIDLARQFKTPQAPSSEGEDGGGEGADGDGDDGHAEVALDGGLLRRRVALAADAVAQRRLLVVADEDHAHELVRLVRILDDPQRVGHDLGEFVRRRAEDAARVQRRARRRRYVS